MALLNSLTINATAGLNHVNYPPQLSGLNIICVKREGMQYERSIGTPVGREWKLVGGVSIRIKFDSNIPFNNGEKVFVIYKPIA